MSNDMVLSVIVPIYNVSKYLDDCLISLLDQGFSEDEYEIICVNDGSTDDSFDKLMKYANLHKNVKVISQDNSGVSAARNKGLDNAKGKYICFVDGDDFLCTGSLKYLCDELAREDDDMIIFNYSTVDENAAYQSNKETISSMTMRNQNNYTLSTATVWSNIVKRSYIDVNNIRFPADLKYGEDSLFEGMLSMFIDGQKQIISKNKFYQYRQRSGSAMHTRGEDKNIIHMRNMLTTIDVWNEFLVNYPDLSDERKQNIKDRIYLCSAAALFDSLRIRSVDSYDIRKKLIEKNAYPYPYMPCIIKQKFNAANIIMFFLKSKVLFAFLAKTRLLEGK